MTTNPFPQNKQFLTASNNSSTTHPCATTGKDCPIFLFIIEGGKKAFRLHPIHVRTHGVERIKTVTEQRGHVCPLPHRADVMFSSGTASPHAGQPSVSIRDILS